MSNFKIDNKPLGAKLRTYGNGLRIRYVSGSDEMFILTGKKKESWNTFVTFSYVHHMWALLTFNFVSCNVKINMIRNSIAQSKILSSGLSKSQKFSLC